MKIVLFLLLAVPVVCLGFNFVSFYSVKNVQHQHIVISGVKSKPEESKSYSNHSTIVKPKQANLKQTNNIAVICVTTGILVFAASKFLVTAVSILQIIG